MAELPDRKTDTPRVVERLDDNTVLADGDIIPAVDLPDGDSIVTNEELIAAQHIVGDPDDPDDAYIEAALQEQTEREYRESHSEGFFRVKRMIEDGIQASVERNFAKLRLLLPPIEGDPEEHWADLLKFRDRRMRRMVASDAEFQELADLIGTKPQDYMKSRKKLLAQAALNPQASGPYTPSDAIGRISDKKDD